MRGAQVDIATDAGAVLGEGPVWDARTRRLVWVDLLPGRVHQYDPATGLDVASGIGKPVGALAPRQAGGWILATSTGFDLADSDWQHLRPLVQMPELHPALRFNDGGCDPAGRFFAGTIAYDTRPEAGTLYRLEPDATCCAVLTEVTISNGLAWAPDGRTMYYIDSATGGIDAFDYVPDTGAIGRRRRFVDIAPADGIPDGLTIDAEGELWVALWGGGAVHRYIAAGTLDQVVQLPVTNITAPAFGGDHLDVLYVTSARLGLDPDELDAQPHAGALFTLSPGVSGLPPFAFAA